LALAPALADPWPNYPSQTTTISYVTVTAVNTGGPTWQYTVTPDPSAALRGVTALAGHPHAAHDAGLPGGWSHPTAPPPGRDRLRLHRDAVPLRRRPRGQGRGRLNQGGKGRRASGELVGSDRPAAGVGPERRMGDGLQRLRLHDRKPVQLHRAGPEHPGRHGDLSGGHPAAAAGSAIPRACGCGRHQHLLGPSQRRRDPGARHPGAPGHGSDPRRRDPSKAPEGIAQSIRRAPCEFCESAHRSLPKGLGMGMAASPKATPSVRRGPFFSEPPELSRNPSSSGPPKPFSFPSRSDLSSPALVG